MAETARQRLIDALREHALVIGEVTLTSGQTAQYLVDAKRATLLPDGFRALGELVAAEAERVGATAVGGMTMGADPIACAALAAGAPVKAFFVRKDRKEHGLQRWVEGPPLEPTDRCLVVEDVVTTGGSAIKSIERIREEGFEIAGVVRDLDRLAGGAEAIRAAAETRRTRRSLTIDDVYPERPDRPGAGEAQTSQSGSRGTGSSVTSSVRVSKTRTMPLLAGWHRPVRWCTTSSATWPPTKAHTGPSVAAGDGEPRRCSTMWSYSSYDRR